MNHSLRWALTGLLAFSLLGCGSTINTTPKTVNDSQKGEEEFQAYLDRKRSGFIGKKVPSMSLTDLQGQSVNPAEMKGKIILLNFWFAACKPCITEIPSLKELQTKYQSNDFVVLSVCTDHRSVVERVVEKHQPNYPMVVGGKAFAERLKVVTFPTSFLIDRKGTIREVFIGASADDATYTYSEVKPHIEVLLQE